MHAPDEKTLKKNHWYNERTLNMPAQMLRSQAFLTLTRTSMIVLMHFMQRRTWDYEGKGRKKKKHFHNKGLRFPYSEAMAYGIGKKSFSRALAELVEHGFLAVVKEGGQLGGHRTCSEYDLIDDWKIYGSKDFRERKKPKGVCTSDGFSKYNDERKEKSEARSRVASMTTDHLSYMTTEISVSV